MPFGILDTNYIDLPVGLDESYIRGLQNRAGVGFDQILREIDARIGAFNDSLDPLMADLMFVTEEMMSEDIAPVAFNVEEAGEYTVARPQYVEGGKALMLPIRKWDVSVGFTEDGLMAMSLARIGTNVDSVLLGLKTRARKEFLKRLFSDQEIPVDAKSTAVNPGFAGSGTGTNVFTRPYPDGTSSAGITHYIGDTTANRIPAIRAARDKIRKWYPNAIVDLLGTDEFIANFLADAGVNGSTNWVQTGSALVRPATSVAEALVDPNVYVGVFDGNIRVRHSITDFAGDYGVVFITFGQLDPQNALAWRFDPLYGREAFLRSRQMFPLDQAVVIQRFGIGVNNRVAAVPMFIDASATYTAPTIA